MSLKNRTCSFLYCPRGPVRLRRLSGSWGDSRPPPSICLFVLRAGVSSIVPVKTSASKRTKAQQFRSPLGDTCTWEAGEPTIVLEGTLSYVALEADGSSTFPEENSAPRGTNAQQSKWPFGDIFAVGIGESLIILEGTIGSGAAVAPTLKKNHILTVSADCPCARWVAPIG